MSLDPGDDVHGYLPQWREVEQKLVGLANREQDEEKLAVYERDLATLREVIAVLEKEPRKKRFPVTLSLWGMFVLLLTGGGMWAQKKWGSQFDAQAYHSSIETEMHLVEQALEKRRWGEVKERTLALRKMGASSEWQKEIMIRMAVGRSEEGGQQIGYFLGGAQAALESANIEEAKLFVSKAKELAPEDPRVGELQKKISESEKARQLSTLVDGIKNAVQDRQWVSAEGQLSDLARLSPDHASLPELRLFLKNAQVQWREDQARSSELYLEAKSLDQGAYSGEALSLLEQAMRLDPNDEVRVLYQKMSSYGRVLTVPGEFPTIGAALAQARARDRVQVAKGVYKEYVNLPPGVVLVGEGAKDTVIECQAKISAVLTMNQAGVMARVVSMTLRHEGFTNEVERFSVVAVSGGNLRLEDVIVDRASGHGVAVVDAGILEMVQSKVQRSGWDGIAVQGEGSLAKLTKVESRENLHHGVDFWDGASGTLLNSKFIKNGRAGLVVISPVEGVSVSDSQSISNREVGVLMSAVPAATVFSCRISKNLLGGVVMQEKCQQVKLISNEIHGNGKAGLVVERGSALSEESENRISGNQGREIWEDAIFSSSQSEEEIVAPIPAPPE